MARGAKVFAPPGRYDSPIVDVSEVRGAGSDAGALVEIPGIDLDVARHDAVWNEWRPFAEQWGQQVPGVARRYHTDNIMFGPESAALLAGALGSIRPRRYIEIGSGFSSAVVLDVNDEQRPDDRIQCTFIEPYPDRLNSILRPTDRDHCTILVEKVQDIDLEVFDQLEAGDILFIDSSHIAKSGSDLLHEVFEILPRLASGVFVHFHDVMYPFDYPLTLDGEAEQVVERALLPARVPDVQPRVHRPLLVRLPRTVRIASGGPERPAVQLDLATPYLTPGLPGPKRENPRRASAPRGFSLGGGGGI